MARPSGRWVDLHLVLRCPPPHPPAQLVACLPGCRVWLWLPCCLTGNRGCLLHTQTARVECRCRPNSSAPCLCRQMHPDFNLSKLLEGARPDASLTSTAATNPIWLVGAAVGRQSGCCYGWARRAMPCLEGWWRAPSHRTAAAAALPAAVAAAAWPAHLHSRLML